MDSATSFRFTKNNERKKKELKPPKKKEGKGLKPLVAVSREFEARKARS